VQYMCPLFAKESLLFVHILLRYLEQTVSMPTLPLFPQYRVNR